MGDYSTPMLRRSVHCEHRESGIDGRMDGNKGDIHFLLFGLSPLATHSFNEAAIKGLLAFEGTERELSAIFQGLKIKQSCTFLTPQRAGILSQLANEGK